MAFRQYTSCIKPANFNDAFAGNEGLIVTAIVGALYLVSLVLAAAWNPAFIILAIGGMTYLILYLEWWLHGRLICLSDQDECLIGVAIGKPSVKAAQKGGDNDASFNVALAPSRVELLVAPDPNSDDRFSTRLPGPKEEYWENAADPTVGNKLQGKFVEPNAQVLGIGLGYVADEGHVRYLKAIHCEFEGSGIQDLLDWAYATLALLLAIAALSAFPGLGLFLTLLALLLSLLGVGAALGGTTWPAEINTPQGFTGTLGLDTPQKVERAIGVWCLSLKQAQDAEDGGSRDDPQNNWVVHPLVDGCARPIIL